MDEKASRLIGCAYSINAIHHGVAVMRHAIFNTKENDWEEYYPTHFIYAFFAFNTLYNIDWERSYAGGRLLGIPPREVRDKGRIKFYEELERTKHECFLKFCFKDDKFVRLYKDFFIRLVLKGNTKEEVIELLSSIRLDTVPNGNVRTKGYVDTFRFAVGDLMNKGKFDKETVKIIVDFIYQVRCNIFHGVKTIEDMQNYSQQDRLDVYASIVIALNQMVFSYLDYLCYGDSFVDSFDRLYESLT